MLSFRKVKRALILGALFNGEMVMRIGAITTAEVIACAVATSTVTGTGVNIKDYEGAVGFTLMSAATTAGDTLDVKLQDAPDNSTWTDIAGATFTQVVAGADAHETIFIQANAQDAYVRAVGTIAGDGGESVAFGVTLFGATQYL